MSYDVIVVGARCAGSPTAMLLARRGYRVLVVDKASFPSDTLSTHYIHQPGVAALDRWGLLPDVIASNCPPVRVQTLDVGPFAITGSPSPSGRIADAYCVRRTILDDLLVRAAREAGAEVRERFTVDELLTEDGRVAGIRGRTPDGVAVTERAAIVVGADGVNSPVARMVGAETYNERPNLTCAYYAYWSGVDVSEAELYPRPGRAVIAAPTNDGQTLVIVYWPASEFRTVRSDVEHHFLGSVELAPRLAERLRAGVRTEPYRGTGRLPNFFRRSHGPGWTLVGDAGYHKDPSLALGITDAFRDAELLSEAVDAGLSGDRELDDALADRERRRDEAAAPGYENTLMLASLEPPPPEMQQLMAALVGDPIQTGRFFGTLIGTYPAEAFFAPDNLAQILHSSAGVNESVANQSEPQVISG